MTASSDSTDLARKLDVFDKHVDEAIDNVIAWLTEYREPLKQLARGRHVWGHFRFRDRLMYEFDEGQLQANKAEEAADLIVYETRRISRPTT